MFGKAVPTYFEINGRSFTEIRQIHKHPHAKCVKTNGLKFSLVGYADK